MQQPHLQYQREKAFSPGTLNTKGGAIGTTIPGGWVHKTVPNCRFSTTHAASPSARASGPPRLLRQSQIRNAFIAFVGGRLSREWAFRYRFARLEWAGLFKVGG